MAYTHSFLRTQSLTHKHTYNRTHKDVLLHTSAPEWPVLSLATTQTVQSVKITSLHQPRKLHEQKHCGKRRHTPDLPITT